MIPSKKKRGMSFMMIKMICWVKKVGSNLSNCISHVGREGTEIRIKTNGKRRKNRRKMMMDAVDNI